MVAHAVVVVASVPVVAIVVERVAAPPDAAAGDTVKLEAADGPCEHLSQVTGIAAHDLEQKTPVKSGDEIGVLEAKMQPQRVR